jgi:hypothetical protein
MSHIVEIEVKDVMELEPGDKVLLMRRGKYRSGKVRGIRHLLIPSTTTVTVSNGITTSWDASYPSGTHVTWTGKPTDVRYYDWGLGRWCYLSDVSSE